MRTLAFDLFGTVLDWRTGLAAAGREIAPHLDPQPDWEEFAVDWSKGYAQAVSQVQETGYLPLRTLLRMAFFKIVPKYKLGRLSESARSDLADAWWRLPAWPDVAEGLDLLRREHVIVTLSNADHDMQHVLQRSAGLPFVGLYSAADAGVYKPDPLVYRRMLSRIRLEPGDVTMVAAHTFDLNAAHGLGMKTALVERPTEPGSSREGLDHTADFIAEDLIGLARAMGCR